MCLERTARLEAGDAVNLSRLVTSPHNGTHADAPLHVREGGDDASTLPPGAFIGPAVVVDAPAVFAADDGELAAAVPRGHRVLLRFGRRDFRRFPEEVEGVPPGWIARLAGREVPLLGTDQPSVDPRESRKLAAHRACLDHGIQIVENLDLSRISPGRYELVALPLRLEGADAAPVRALLRRSRAGRPGNAAPTRR